MSYSNNVVYVLDASSQSSLYSVGTSGVADVYTPQIGNCVDITTDGKNFFTASQLGDIFKFNTTNNTVKSFNSGIQANSIQIINNKIYVFAQTLNTGSIFDIDGFNLLYNINFS
jgi:hypothetical protein